LTQLAQFLYGDKSTKQNSFQLKSMSINVNLGIVSSIVRTVLSRHAMAMKNDQSLNKREDQ